MEAQENNIVNINNKTINKQLLNIDEFCKYLNIGKTQGRSMLKDSNCVFSLKIGNRWYAHKEALDQWLYEQIYNK